MAATPAFIERAYGVTNIRSHIPITLDLSEKHNYYAWRQLFLTHCGSFGFHGHLDGTLVSNGDGDVSWKNRDETVKLWLYTTLSPSLSRVVFHNQSTSREIWLRIENQFRSNLNAAAPEYGNRGNSFQRRPQYQQLRAPYLPRPSPMWQPEQYLPWSYPQPQHQPYVSSGVEWNRPLLSNSYNNWQNPGFGNMYGPPSPDLQAFSAMNLQEPMGAPQSYNMDMGATTPHPWAHNSSPEASTSRFTPQALKENQIQIVQCQSEPFTHFVSIPLVYPELRDNLLAFKDFVLNKMEILAERRIDDSLFASPNTFHLTVVMLKLGSKGSLDKAQSILKDISPKVSLALKKRPVFITLKGLDCMNGYLEKTRVLYAPVEEVGDEGRLLKACHVIIDAFDSAKLAGEDPKSDFKLHATVMNTTYRNDKSKEMNTFDAREIHKEFGNKDWGTYLIKEAHISRRYPFDPNVYFRCCGSLSFLEN